MWFIDRLGMSFDLTIYRAREAVCRIVPYVAFANSARYSFEIGSNTPDQR